MAVFSSVRGTTSGDFYTASKGASSSLLILRKQLADQSDAWAKLYNRHEIHYRSLALTKDESALFMIYSLSTGVEIIKFRTSDGTVEKYLSS